MVEGHTKESFLPREDKTQEVKIILTEYYCKICRDITVHNTKYFPFNLKNAKEKWCSICEESTQDTTNCTLNMKNKMNYHTVYQTKEVN